MYFILAAYRRCLRFCCDALVFSVMWALVRHVTIAFRVKLRCVVLTDQEI